MVQPSDEALAVGKALGADAASTQCFAIYVPNKDRNGREIGDQRRWVLAFIQLLSDLNGGATAMPPVEGGWTGGGAIVWEEPVVVYSFIQAEAFFAALPRIRELVHRMGRETDQGEVAFEFDSIFFRIMTFDPPQGAGP